MKRSAISMLSVSVLAGALTLSTVPAHAAPPAPGGGPVGCALDGAADLPLGALGDRPGDCLRADRHAGRQAGKPAPSPLDTAGKLVRTTQKVTHTASKVTNRLGVAGAAPVGRYANARKAQVGGAPALPGGRFVNGSLGQGGGILGAPDVPGVVRSADAAGLPVGSSMLFPPAGRRALRDPAPGGDLLGQVGQTANSATGGVGGVQQSVGQVVTVLKAT
ncbi:hypothetical protein [Actinomadura sp. NEAU-AAG7]|uniref:hypothetical protein n=1 Tax=Actinomadura sp. NEAU-AAG7 TaxID=2839640 RepID=UPI001BE43C4E|nr:hypothetical protein [Actinomadura sp. NEAU-AAG7]MBT2206754.1 hypothetical protein [Actinomadura sp. NEAU-AAG7]